MHRIVVVAEIEDAAKWEEGFRTHGDLFRSQTVTSCHYSITGDHVAVYFEAEDLDAYLQGLESPETAEAMAVDGLKQETVKVFVVDKQFTP